MNNFKYLGSILTKDGKWENDIKQRIGIAGSSFNKMSNLICYRHIRMTLRIRLIKKCIWSTLLYGCETWIINKEMVKRLKVFEMTCWRRMLRVI